MEMKHLHGRRVWHKIVRWKPLAAAECGSRLATRKPCASEGFSVRYSLSSIPKEKAMKKVLISIFCFVLTLSYSHPAASQEGPVSMDDQLIQAATNNDLEAVRQALDKGAHIDAKTTDEDGWTALISSIYRGNNEVVKLLLKKGANTEVPANDGTTALIRAAIRGDAEIAKLLLEKGAHIEARNNVGETALMMAARYGSAEVVNLLLAKGASVEAKDNKGSTALMMAAISDINPVPVVRLLLKKGANVDVQNNNGDTALKLATTAGNAEVVKLLREKGAH
jgi:ankyrin repeat protein